ncbi:MAG: type II toxin-antitoxin system VapC family toxin [Syntrophobacteraceae bacterium]
MTGLLVDSNILLDVFEDDPVWAQWSEEMLEYFSATHILCINPVIYAEVSVGFGHIEELEAAIAKCGVRMLEIPREALFLAAKAFIEYRRRKGIKASPLPDFFIGAHAAVENLALLTRDVSRYKSYFPTVNLISPKDSNQGGGQYRNN